MSVLDDCEACVLLDAVLSFPLSFGNDITWQSGLFSLSISCQ